MGVLWFFLLLAPTSSLVPLADLLMEHRVYLACLGPFLGVAAGAERLLARAPAGLARWSGPVLVAAIWVGLAGATWRRNAVWASRLALWSDAAAKSPAKPRPHGNLCYALRERGRTAEALAECQLGLSLPGADPAVEALLLRGMAVALFEAGRLDEAEVALRRALAIDASDAEVIAKLGLLVQRRGDVSTAEMLARRALALRPEQGDALQLLGIAAMSRRDFAEAVQRLERSVQADPKAAVWLVNLGVAYEQAARPAEACAAWARALRLRLDPGQRRLVAARMASRGCAGP
jgi:tetratricopeptide (TPR) repeat protein